MYIKVVKRKHNTEIDISRYIYNEMGLYELGFFSRNQCSAAASAAAAAAAGFRPIPNSISMPSVRSNPASAIGTYVVRQAQAQTQTERKLSCLKQFLFCLLANQVFTAGDSFIISLYFN